MDTRFRRAAAVAGVVLAAAVASPAVAQTARGGGGAWGPSSSYGRLYDARRVETLSGEVARVEEFTPQQGAAAGVHALVRTADGRETWVHLGPSWYMERQRVRLQAGDRVRVTGSRASYGGQPVLIASEVRRGDSTLRLREKDGSPRWMGSGQGSGQGRGAGRGQGQGRGRGAGQGGGQGAGQRGW